MKSIQITQFKCEKCMAIYDSEAEAVRCESKAVTQDRGVKVGDKVRITRGDGEGCAAVVREVAIVSKDWGHYAWQRYWHTVALIADIAGSTGSRFLTFDDYEVVK